MKILQTTRKHLTILGIKPTQSTRIFSFNMRLSLGFGFFAIAIGTSALFAIYLANDVLDYILSFCVISALIEMCFCFATIALQKRQLFNYIESMEILINSRLENPTSKAIHGATNRQNEKISGFLYVAMGLVSPQLIIWPKCVVSFVTYFFTDLGSDAFQLPIPVWFPLEWDNPIGYVGVVSLECMFTTYIFFFMMVGLCIGIACYLFGISLTEDMKSVLCSIDENSKIRKYRQNLYGQFVEFVYIHSAAKRSMSMFSRLFQPIFMVFFPRSMLALCWTLLLIQLELSHRADYGLALLALAYDAFNSFALIFISCELCQRLSDAFNDFDDIIIQFKWYLFPNKLKQILPTMMLISQEPVTVECFGSISCCRDVFLKMLNSVLSYFMVLRQCIK